METRKTTNTLLLILVIPVVFYLLKVLDFIFIPLTAAMFITLLFLPLMRWFKRKNIHKGFAIAAVIAIIFGVLKLAGELISLSSAEILSADNSFFEQAEGKINDLIIALEGFFGVKRGPNEQVMAYYFPNGGSLENFGDTFKSLQATLSTTLMTIFFVILLLVESINFEKIMNRAIFKHRRHASIKTFAQIEKDIIKFVKVKFIVSLLTGIGFTLACFAFDVSFPIFWGLFAFLINFVQFIGSIISVVLLSIFALVELDPTGTLVFFIVVIAGVQAIFGGVVEPVLMGRTFSVNVVTVLVMLMLWGFIWGIPGLIMSIPITVFLRIIFDQFRETKLISELMAGPGRRKA
ncbi:MAG: AI-2E family transporter [bacterium]|nr:AI-2E family transporter [bacterium]